jgi:hypothetical protein
MSRKSLGVFLSFVVMMSCNSKPENQPINTVTYNPLLSDTFFLTENWSYPEFTTKNDDGKFSFSMQGFNDTSHLYHTANIMVISDSLNENEEYYKTISPGYQLIQFGKAHKVGKTIFLKFEQYTPSSHDDLTIKIKNGYFFSSYERGFPAIGNKYYDFDKESLVLQKETNLVGDTLRGYLDFKIYKPKYLHLKGAFKMKIMNDEK